MHRTTRPRLCRRLPSLPAAALAAASSLPLLVAPLVAQNERVQQLIERAFAELGDPATAPDAARSLEHLGAIAVRPICEQLAPGRTTELDTAAKTPLFLVLARLGKQALPALPTLRDVLRKQPELADDAAFALTMLAPFLHAEQCQILQKDLGGLRADARGTLLVRILEVALRTASAPADARSLMAMLEADAVQSVVACRWLAARHQELADGRDALAAALRARLVAVTERPPIRDRSERAFDGPDTALAWLALTGAPLEAISARVLLDHWHVDERRRGIAWMREHGRTLPLRERADLVARLWDSEPALVAAAAAALAGWGRDAAVALPPLRLIERRYHGSGAAACGDAAAAILAAATAALPASDQPWLAAADRALQGDPPPTPDTRCGEAGRQLLGEALYLAQWHDTSSLANALRVVEAAGTPSADTVLALCGWLRHEHAGVVDVASAWLARHGIEAQRAYERAHEGGGTFASWLRTTTQYQVVSNARRASIEMLAHVACAGTGRDERIVLLDDANTRVVTHALATLLAEPRGALRACVDRLLPMLDAPATQTLKVVASAWDPRELPVDLGKYVRALAAVALVDLDVQFTPPEDLDDVLRQTLGIPLADLPRRLADLRGMNRMPELLDQVEDQCRLLMSVPPHLRWPSFRTR
jgi:hypothetical protein